MKQETFSRRVGICPEMAEIVIRNDAPSELRWFLYQTMKDYMGLKKIREIVCKTIHTVPDPRNWGENGFMDSEIENHINSCRWYRIYDIIEKFYQELDETHRNAFENSINEFFYENGIGWKVEQGTIISRGDNFFEEALNNAKETLIAGNLLTSKNEITEAISDLSRRPNPEITGAVQHAIASLECVCREISGSKDTLGTLIKNNPGMIPSPLDIAVEKIFGYASEHGRHLQERREPSFDEAFLLVHISASLCTYLANKKSHSNIN